MKLEMILGNNIDTKTWISHLLSKGAENIVVLDYEIFNKSEVKDGILFLSNQEALHYMRKFNSINFYKSLYGYPGMGGEMSLLYNKKK